MTGGGGGGKGLGGGGKGGEDSGSSSDDDDCCHQAPTPAPTAEPVQSTTDMYFVPAVAGIIVAIAIGFAITIIVQRKRP
jgi:hypothetical protein